MNDIRSSRWLKTICYIAVPILIAVIVLNLFSLAYYANYEEDINGTVNYFQTERFASDYLSTVYRAVYNINNNRTISLIMSDAAIMDEIETTTTNENTIELKEKLANTEKISYNLSNYVTTYAYEMVIVLKDGSVATNVPKTVETDTLEGLKKYISDKPYQWIYDGKDIKTDIEKLQYNQIAYDPQFEDMKEMGVQIYTSLKDENQPQMYRYNLIYETVSRTYLNAPIVSTICSLILLAVGVYLLFSIGHKKGQEGIYTDALDQIPLEIVAAISAILIGIEGYLIGVFSSMAYNIEASYMIKTGISLDVLMAILMYITIVITGITVVRRLKAHTFWKSTLCYKLFKFITNTANRVTGELFKNFSTTVKLAAIFGGSIAISLILVMLIQENFFFVFILLAFWYYLYKKLLMYANSVSKIRNKIEKMYKGNVDDPLNVEEFGKEFKEIAIQLNDISGGLSNAIEEAMKSERLKTELITNVSHDIKTPLTSIINYIDLMKKENIDNPQVQEYLQVLENKSQRLKKLTEDLVEASKASSGNIKLTMEKLDVKELMKQVGGEFEDRFTQKGLQIIESFPQELVYIQADSRYMYRVLENMYINIAKYSLENSRVYVDVTQKEDTVEIELKNISQDKLNISVDELMQRFVRGDSSRTTEGSGLGISIAKSLTNLQKGELDIYLDGDLFKVVIRFKSM